MKKKRNGNYSPGESIIKILLRMKLLSVFILLAVVTASGNGYSQQTKFKLSLHNATVRSVFEEIEENSEFILLYDEKNVDVNRIVNVTANNESVKSILDQVFEGTGNKYKIFDRQIIISGPENTEFPAFLKQTQQPLKVSGKVTDPSGSPLPGVTVLIKGTVVGTITGSDGSYSLPNVPVNATLIFSFVGMKSQEIKVEGKLTVNVVLEEEAIGIEEVVAIGYGTQKKVNLTGSISQVKADELTEIPVPTLAQAAMGKASGVFIKNVNGQPGDDTGVEINIRGFGEPLFIVDGMSVSESYFQQLDPNDIENFNILKDASAAAVYGARAGNGVILVKTKRGNISKPSFTYSGNYGFQFLTIVPDFVSSAQYAEMENMARYNQGLTPLWTEEEIQKFRDGSDPLHYPNTDWWGATLRNFAPQQQHNISVRGGTEKVKYFVSGGYYHQDGILKSDDIKNNRYSLRSNLDIELTKRLSMGIDISIINQDYIGPRNQLERTGSIVGIMTMLYRARPYWSNEPFPDPSYAHAMGTGEISPATLSEIDYSGYKKWNKLSGDAKINFAYSLPYGFTVRAVFDYSRIYLRNKEKAEKTPVYTYNWDTGEYKLITNVNSMSSLVERQDITNSMTQQYFLNWDKKFKDHSLSAMLVYEKLSNNYDYFSASRQNYQFDIDYLFAGPDLDKDNTGSGSEGGRKAWIGRINYDYKGKYLFEVSSRYDGSANFPPDSRWGFFPSASAGWRISEENFIKDNLPFVNNLKLRASHGLLGYDAAGSFQYLATYSVKSSYIYDNTNVLSSGIRADALPNTSITWEKMRTTNAGVDFSLWNSMLEGSFDYFYRKRTDVLGARTNSIPDIVGASMPNVNYAAYDNRGWELTLNHSSKIGDIKYSVGGNISWNREKILVKDHADFANEELRRRGDPIGDFTDELWTYPTDGLFKSFEEIQGWADIDGKNNATIKPGDVKYIDSNGDGQITVDDMIIAGRGSYPKLTYGLNMSVAWKGFDLSMLWQGAGLYNYSLRSSPDLAFPFYAGNTPTTDMYYNSYVPEGNPWMEANTDGRWPLVRTDSYNRSHPSYKTANQFWLIDGSYIRLKNIQLGYTIPKKLISRWGIGNCKVYVSGYNLLTFSELDFVDPEIDTDAAKTFGDYHPPMGSYNVGVIVNF